MKSVPKIGLTRFALPLLIPALGLVACAPKDQAPAEPAESEASAVAVKKPTSPDIGMSEQAIVREAIAHLTPEVRLGVRLFHDNRLGNPGANLATSCRTCHTPPEASSGERQYADGLALSVLPASARGSKRETLRNTPSLLDIAGATTFGAEGSHDSLDEFLKFKLLSEHMGWLPGEEGRATDEIFALLLNDQGEDPLAEGSYIEQFKNVKNIDVESLSKTQAFDLVVASVADYLQTLKTHSTAAWDALAYLNRLNEGLSGPGDTPQDLAGRIFGRIANQEGRVLIRFPNIYNESAYQGMKTFMRVIPTWSSSVEGMEENIGNCIACHIPPKFTDGAFHNIGISQLEYDATHGDDAFAALSLTVPSDATRARVDTADPARSDLGRWNANPVDTSIGAFKTPGLRFAEKTAPYMHNGAHATLEDAIRAHITAADLARAGKLRNPDPELLKVSGLSEQDIANLADFIRTLTEVPEEQYRDFRITDVRIRQDPMHEQTFDN